MRVIRTSAALIVLAVLATATVGQERQQPAPATPPAPSTETPPPAEAPAPSTETPPTAPPTGVMRDEQFIPTQELQADEEATFPVDI
jgi:hypothetical protein